MKRLQPLFLVDAFGVVAKEDGVAVKGDAEFFLDLRLIFSRSGLWTSGGRHFQRDGFADVFRDARRERVARPGHFEIRKWLGAAGEDRAANGGELVFGGGAEDAQSGDRVVARENHNLGQGMVVGLSLKRRGVFATKGNATPAEAAITSRRSCWSLQ